MNELNIRMSCDGRLCQDWKKAKTHYVNTIAVHTSKKETIFVDLVCNEKRVKCSKGSLVMVSGYPIIKTYNNKGRFLLFVSEVYNAEWNEE